MEKDYSLIRQPMGTEKGFRGITKEDIEEIYRTATTYREAAARLGVTTATYKKHALKYGLLIKGGCGKKHHARMILESEIKRVHEVALNATDAAKKLGVCGITYKKYAVLYGLYYDFIRTNKTRKKKTGFKTKIPIEDIIAGKHPSYSVSYFKERLFRSGLKNRECEICGYNERRTTDGLSPLLIMFLDGDKRNWALSNIKIICYNCTYITDKNRMGRPRRHDKEPWYDRLSWESNVLSPKNYVLARESGSMQEAKGKDIDVTNIDSISEDELEKLKNEAKNEIKH